MAVLSLSVFGTVLARPFVKEISVEKASMMVFSMGHHDLVVIDIRPIFMFASSHIPGAINVEVIEFTGETPPVIFHWDDLADWINSPNGQSHLNDKIIIHCIGGSASPVGAQTLVDSGFKKVNNMEGGFNAWLAAGYVNLSTIKQSIQTL